MAKVNDTTRGIQISGISKMQTAIREYKSTVQKKVNSALNYKEYQKLIDDAIKGDNSQRKLQKVLEDIRVKESNLVSQLDKWDKYLDNLSTQYKSQEQKFTF